jgi:hypothetical protein
MSIKRPFQKLFRQSAKNLATGGQIVRVEMSSKPVHKPFIKSKPKRG